ncbi:unnamed protein product [Hymenolepis diminuta]|uniref:Cyclic nucleotide-binding domain-containing protein n=1 Tax=Hymenolepis diminuta TaxID=6216 RepID=A0A0R3SS11_HYMDI|nr:unnamed protein product [Hymenolepis diminuta]VUZ42884.1 unnamed protein product [Hymenolepis diminuta]
MKFSIKTKSKQSAVQISVKARDSSSECPNAFGSTGNITFETNPIFQSGNNRDSVSNNSFGVSASSSLFGGEVRNTEQSNMSESFTQIGLPEKSKTQSSEISTPLLSEVPKTGNNQMQHLDDFHRGHLFPFKTHSSAIQTTSELPSQPVGDDVTKQPNNASRSYFLLSGDIYLVKPPHSVRAFTQEEVDVATFLGNYPNGV